MELFDTVRLKEDISHDELQGKLCLHDEVPVEGLKKGTKGAIVEIYSKPSLAYEVEFFDEQGSEIGLLTVEPHQVELLKTF